MAAELPNSCGNCSGNLRLHKNNFSYLKMTLLMEWNVVNGWMDEKNEVE